MTQNPKQSKAVAYLRQICCSGLGSEIVIPEFLRALHQVIPSDRNWYTSVDEQFNYIYQIPDYFIPEFVGLAEIVAIIMPDFTRKTSKPYEEWFSRNSVLTNEGLISVVKDYYKSDFYNLIFRRIDQFHIVETCVKNQGGVTGIFSLTRPHNSQPFNPGTGAVCAIKPLCRPCPGFAG
jgi:hypothetical protein